MSVLTAKKTEYVVKKSLEEVDERRKGLKSKGLRTRWNKLNAVMGGGFQWNYNYLIAGLSGSGKSTLANIIETDIFDNNPEEKFIVLNFNFETDSTMNMLKKFSADTGFTMDQIISADSNLEDEAYNLIKEKSNRFNKYNIFYFDVSGTTSDVEETIHAFYSGYRLPMFCILDHTGLVTPQNKENELQSVATLANMTIRVKKLLPASFLMLGQLNSNIEQLDRIQNPSLQKPMRSDLFGGKSVWNAMDCIFMPHRPELLGIEHYTADEYPTKNKMFFHVSKQRFGKLGMIMMDCEKLGQNIVSEL